MRREERMAQKLAAAFTAGDADPHRLVRVFGEVLNAQWCEFLIAGRRYEWSSSGQPAGQSARRELSADPEIVVSIAPAGAMPDALQCQPLLVLLEPAAFAAAVEHEQRYRHDAVQRLHDARWQASVEMARERRHLERDLHDGAQHHLVALQMAIALAEHGRDDPGADDRLDAVRTHLESLERVLVDTARGVLPRTLADEGLNGALQALAGPGLAVDSRLPRLMPAVESALYFIVLEAISNAHKHAAGAEVAIQAWAQNGRIMVVIRDEGPGFVVREGAVGGLSHLAERLGTLNGKVQVDSAPGQGTRITATIRL